VRGRGLLIGMEIDPEAASAKALCKRLREHGVLTRETRETVIRFAPPLAIARHEIDWALERIRAALGEPEPAAYRSSAITGA
jgi:ornithine--oxo-acid transaminase